MVTKRLEESVGVIIDAEKANSVSLKNSSHSRHLIDNSQDIYYVFFPGSGITGPYYSSELRLKSEHNEAANQ